MRAQKNILPSIEAPVRALSFSHCGFRDERVLENKNRRRFSSPADNRVNEFD
jgi:hypothetical protein